MLLVMVAFFLPSLNILIGLSSYYRISTRTVVTVRCVYITDKLDEYQAGNDFFLLNKMLNVRAIAAAATLIFKKPFIKFLIIT